MNRDREAIARIVVAVGMAGKVGPRIMEEEGHPKWLASLEAADAILALPVGGGVEEVLLAVRDDVRAVIDAAMDSAIPEPWEVSAKATDNVLALVGAALSPTTLGEES